MDNYLDSQDMCVSDWFLLAILCFLKDRHLVVGNVADLRQYIFLSTQQTHAAVHWQWDSASIGLPKQQHLNIEEASYDLKTNLKLSDEVDVIIRA